MPLLVTLTKNGETSSNLLGRKEAKQNVGSSSHMLLRQKQTRAQVMLPARNVTLSIIMFQGVEPQGSTGMFLPA